MKEKSLTFAFWNIAGFKSRLFGNKLSCVDFLKEIEGYDVVGLAETHIHEVTLSELAIPGYTLLGYKNRARNPKSNTAPGGIALFVKKTFPRFSLWLNATIKTLSGSKLRRS